MIFRRFARLIPAICRAVDAVRSECPSLGDLQQLDPEDGLQRLDPMICRAVDAGRSECPSLGGLQRLDPAYNGSMAVIRASPCPGSG